MPKKSQTKTNVKMLALEEKLKRALADYSNLEKRIHQQRQFFATMTAAGIISQMIQVLDDLQLAQKHLKDDGLKITIDKFQKILQKEGLKEVETRGKEFDPKLMDCVDVATGKQDYVVSVRKKGYTLNNQVIRPAQVVVGRQIKN